MTDVNGELVVLTGAHKIKVEKREKKKKKSANHFIARSHSHSESLGVCRRAELPEGMQR